MVGLEATKLQTRSINLHSGTHGKITGKAGLEDNLKALGLNITVSDEVTSAKERTDLQTVLGQIQEAVEGMGKLTHAQITDRQGKATLFDGISSQVIDVIKAIGEEQKTGITTIDDPIVDAAENIVAREIKSSVLLAKMETDGDLRASVAALNITVVEDAGDKDVVNLTQGLSAIRDSIKTNVSKTHYNKLANYVKGYIGQSITEFETKINELKAANQESTKSLRPTLSLDDGNITFRGDFDAKFDDIRHFDKTFLKGRFKQALAKMKMLESQIGDIGSAALKKELITYALDYMVKGAMINIMDEQQGEDLPPLEFRGARVNSPSSYHRAAANMPVVQLFKEILHDKAAGYDNLFWDVNSDANDPTSSRGRKYQISGAPATKQYGAGRKRDQTILIDSKDFINTIKNEFVINTAGGGIAARLASINLPMADGVKSKQFLDMSQFITAGDSDPGTLETQLDAIRVAIESNKANLNGVLVGAVIKVKGVEMLHIFDTANNRTGKDALSLKSRSINSLAGYGARTDKIKLRDAIAGMATIGDVIGKLPIQTTDTVITAGMVDNAKFTKELVQGASTTCKTALATLKTAATGGSRAEHYYKMLERMMDGVENKLKNYSGDDNKISKHIYESLGKIGDLALEMKNCEGDYRQFMNKVELAVEEVIHVLTLANPDEVDIAAMINPKGVAPGDPGITKKSFVFNSGMKSISQVIDGIRAMQTGVNKPVGLGAKLSIGHARDMYFEGKNFVGGVRNEINAGHAKETFSGVTSVDDPDSQALLNFDVFCLDFFPNDASQTDAQGVKTHNVIDIAKKLIVGRDATKPVTLVVDSTTDLYSGSSVQDLIADPTVKGAIKDGKLNVVVFNSLAKFSMAGMDKYTGGVVQSYNNNSLYFQDFTSHLTTMQSKPELSLSKKANQYFSMMLDPVRGELSIKDHLTMVRANTNSMVQKLRAPAGATTTQDPINGDDAFVRLVKREGHADSNIPTLAISLDKMMAKFPSGSPDERNVQKRLFKAVHMYLFGQMRSSGQPVNLRGSFGFSHTTFTEIVSPHTFRMTVGLEDDGDLKRYADILRSTNKQLTDRFNASAVDRTDFATKSDTIDTNLGNKETFKTIMNKMKQYRVNHAGADMTFVMFMQLCETPDAFNPLA